MPQNRETQTFQYPIHQSRQVLKFLDWKKLGQTVRSKVAARTCMTGALSERWPGVPSFLSWPASWVCRTRSMCLHDRTTVWSGAGTPQVPCLEWCRYPAGALSGVVQVPRRCPVWSGAEIGLMNLLIQRFPGCVIRRLSVCTRVPHREGNSMVGPLFSVGIQTRLEYAGGWRSEEGEITLRMVDSTEFCISMLSRLAESKLRSAKAQRDR